MCNSRELVHPVRGELVEAEMTLRQAQGERRKYAINSAQVLHYKGGHYATINR